MTKYKNFKESVSNSPKTKITDDEWDTFKELASIIDYSSKQTGNKKQRKELLLEKLIGMESQFLEFDKKQKEKRKELEKENKQSRAPAKATIHQIPQNQPTEAIYKDKPVTQESKSNTYFSNTNIGVGLGIVGTAAGVVYNVMGKTKHITPSNSDEELKNLVNEKYKKLEKEGTIKAIKRSFKEHDMMKASGGGGRFEGDQDIPRFSNNPDEQGGL